MSKAAKKAETTTEKASGTVRKALAFGRPTPIGTHIPDLARISTIPGVFDESDVDDDCPTVRVPKYADAQVVEVES